MFSCVFPCLLAEGSESRSATPAFLSSFSALERKPQKAKVPQSLLGDFQLPAGMLSTSVVNHDNWSSRCNKMKIKKKKKKKFLILFLLKQKEKTGEGIFIFLNF